jgi:hypothetical protein
VRCHWAVGYENQGTEPGYARDGKGLMNDVKNDPIGLLERAFKRIEDPAGWCQGSTAEDADGKPVTANNPSACRWCAVGALLAECGAASLWDSRLPTAYHSARDVLDAAAMKIIAGMPGRQCISIVPANDWPGIDHDKIKTMFTIAIASAKDKWGQDDLV